MSQWFSLIAEILTSYGTAGLFIISFAESSFFPVPPDLIMIPLALIKPGQALWYASLTTAGSVLGGLFGYLIGIKAGRPALERFFPKAKITRVEELFSRYGGWAVAIAGFTPIPYKVFTIASGIFKIDVRTFVFASLIGRGMRFFMEALAIIAFGQAAQHLFSQYMELTTIIITVSVITVILMVNLIRKKRNRVS